MGFEIERFVCNINESLICQICCKVYEEPKMLSSCEHVFCFGCIEKYIINGNHCPLDQKKIDSSHIEEAPKFIHEFMSNLKIKCDFEEFGCKEVISLPRLMLHRLNCHFHPERRVECNDCGFEAERVEVSQHNCLNVLKNKVDHMSQQLEELKRCHSRDIQNLKSRMQRKDNFQNCFKRDYGKGSADRKMISFSCIGDTQSGTHELIFIQTSHLTLQCEVTLMTKVETIKYNASMIANLNTTDYSLFSNGTQLKDNRSLSHYDIRNGTICHLLPNHIFITFDCVDIRQIIEFSVDTNDTIQQIIQKLNQQIKKLVPDQLFLYLQQCSCSLFFDNIKLEESYGLSNYDVFAIKTLKYCN